jgi:hypothetical protein
MSRKFNGSFEFSARCMAGNGLGASPLHHIPFDGRVRMHSAWDVAGIAAVGLAGNGGLAGIEAAFLAAARDGRAMTPPRTERCAAPRLSRLAALVVKVLPRRLGSGWLPGSLPVQAELEHGWAARLPG